MIRGKRRGRGKIKINLGKLFLAPGIYMFKFSAWDKEMIHTYAVRSKDIIRVAMGGAKAHQTEAIFIPHVEWKI